ncbi:hypothetical protein VTI28DRAFT_9099 [Corynascus sepedonium]
MSYAASPAKTDAQRAADVLRALQDLQSASTPEEAYTILKLSEPITSAIPSNNAGDNTNTRAAAAANRTSDVSTTSVDSNGNNNNNENNSGPTPASLEADLAHYRELFAKLRFSYVEQVTKEKFIRAIVGDPPLIVAPHEIAELEAGNAAAKAELKALKVEVAGMAESLGRRGRELAGRYEDVRAGAARLRELPPRIEEFERSVRELRARQKESDEVGGSGAAAPGMNLPLGKTRELVEARRRELGAVERELETLGAQVPRKRKEMERLRAEVAALENRRANSAAAAREAKRRKENAQGGVEDELEARGRWYRASEAVLRQVLDLQPA